jgi:hypothetical protein
LLFFKIQLSTFQNVLCTIKQQNAVIFSIKFNGADEIHETISFDSKTKILKNILLKRLTRKIILQYKLSITTLIL